MGISENELGKVAGGCMWPGEADARIKKHARIEKTDNGKFVLKCDYKTQAPIPTREFETKEEAEKALEEWRQIPYIDQPWDGRYY